MDNPIHTGVLAYGMSGRLFHVPFIAGNNKFKLTGVVERHKKQVEADYPGAKSYDSVEALMHHPEVELVIVNTPNHLHYEHVWQALENGKHVLVEKPFVATAQEAKSLFSFACARQRHIFVYQNRRFDSDYNAVRRVLQSGKLGKLIEMYIGFDRYRPSIGPKLFKEKPFPASGVTYDLGSHLIDQCIALFGHPLKSLKIDAKNRIGSEVDDYVHFILFYPNQFVVYVTASHLVADPGPAYIIHGRNGSFKKNHTDVQEEQLGRGMSPFAQGYGLEPVDQEGVLTTWERDVQKQEKWPSAEGNYNVLFEAVYDTVRNNKPFPVVERDILVQLEILEQPAFLPAMEG